MVVPKPYGCHNRKPIVTVCKPTCQYTYSELGQADPRCIGCHERHVPGEKCQHYPYRVSVDDDSLVCLVCGKKAYPPIISGNIGTLTWSPP